MQWEQRDRKGKKTECIHKLFLNHDMLQCKNQSKSSAYKNIVYLLIILHVCVIGYFYFNCRSGLQLQFGSLHTKCFCGFSGLYCRLTARSLEFDYREEVTSWYQTHSWVQLSWLHVFWTVWGNPEHPPWTHADLRRQCKFGNQTHFTTVPPRIILKHLICKLYNESFILQVIDNLFTVWL